MSDKPDAESSPNPAIQAEQKNAASTKSEPVAAAVTPSGAGPQGDMQAVGEESDEDVRFDAAFELVIDGA